MNLACGNSYVVSPDWTNLDFFRDSKAVKSANLLRRLPLPDSSCQLIYSSHFFEHIPRAQIGKFLDECLRVLCPGGTLRLVLPDLESIVMAYLENRRMGLHDRANFAVLELIDQCVRTRRGGEMGDLFQTLENQEGPESEGLKAFIFERVGEAFELSVNEEPVQKLGILTRSVNTASHLAQNARIAFQKLLLRFWLAPLPSAFKAQNLSFADVGEKHHWVWDFHQLSEALQRAGYSRIVKQDCNISLVGDFPFYPLDIDKAGKARKGRGSMYVEATKPVN